MADAEVWKAIPGVNGYEASTLGRIRSVDRLLSDGRSWKGRVLQKSIDSGHYESVTVGRDQRRQNRQRRVHSLVMLAFHGNAPLGMEVRHRDGNKQNNVLSNLIYGTRSDNESDKIEHGRSNRGHQRSGAAKLTEGQVSYVRHSALRNYELAKVFGVSRVTISNIRRRVNWKWLDVEDTEK